jgi:hypothetical protein
MDGDAEVQDLARRLTAVAEAIDRARGLGLPVSVPPDLYRACQAIVRRADGDGTGPGTPLAESTPDVQDVPLRKLLFRVIAPGDRFTVQEIAERLTALGVQAPANSISNALGSWVRADRLIRERKGQYLCPLPEARPDRGNNTESGWADDGFSRKAV